MPNVNEDEVKRLIDILVKYASDDTENLCALVTALNVLISEQRTLGYLANYAHNEVSHKAVVRVYRSGSRKI